MKVLALRLAPLLPPAPAPSPARRSAQPSAKATSTMMTIGACHSRPKNQRTARVLLVVQRKGEQREKEKGCRRTT
jgi:hypothetical protein